MSSQPDWTLLSDISAPRPTDVSGDALPGPVTASVGGEEGGAGPDPQIDREDGPKTSAVRPAGTDEPEEQSLVSGLQDRVTTMLLFDQVVSSEQVEAALQQRRDRSGEDRDRPLWRSFLQQAGVDRDRVFMTAAWVYSFSERPIDLPSALEFLKEIRQHFSDRQWQEIHRLGVVPVDRERDARTGTENIVFVSFDPTNAELTRFLRGLNLRYAIQYAPEAAIRQLLNRGFSKKTEYLDRVRKGSVSFGDHDLSERDEGLDNDALDAEINQSALLALFDAMLVEAVRDGASDIHVVPGADGETEIHFRIHGELQNWHVDKRCPPSHFVAVIKDQTNGIDRFERDAAQDGYIQRRLDGGLVRFRVSVLPIANANLAARPESIVLRVLDDRKVSTDLRELNLSDLAHERLERALRQPHGMVIATGPTGTGKSTTLRAALHHIVSSKLNILTIEDPVEYMIPDVRQIRVNHKLPVEAALRYILRHDPDVVMVGEMRDRTTAELAVKLANTGHLTLSTLHTNDAASAIGRLYKMGIEPYLLGYAVNLVVAQRLVRTLCPTCKQRHTGLSPDLLHRLNMQESDAREVYREGADPHCEPCGGTSYVGRQAIAEALELSDPIRAMIVRAGELIDEDAVRKQARQEGMLMLSDAARKLVLGGQISVMEMVRVTGG